MCMVMMKIEQNTSWLLEEVLHQALNKVLRMPTSMIPLLLRKDGSRYSNV